MPPRPAPFRDLRSFVSALERRGLLRRIRVEVDPRLEVSEIAQRVVRDGGPALLFERPRGSTVPLVMNLFGSMERIELALGRHPEAIGRELVETLDRLNPPSLRAFWEARGVLARARYLRPKVVATAPVQEVVEPPNLLALPQVTTWPRDGGPFITFGPTLTQDPASGRRNFGLYRLQIFGPGETGMHWQSMKGGRGHYWEAERRGEPLEAAVVLGGDPVLMLSAVFPLPEGFDELAFAGFFRGAPTRLVRSTTGPLLVPADAEIVLEGYVPPGERRIEGPFGDHFGHYSEASPFPVFHVRRLTRRRDALYPATVVGKPPQEDKFLGIAAGEMIGPLIRVIAPNVVALNAFDGAGFHNLLGVSLRERHPKEALKTALALLGTGQLTFSKVTVLVRDHVNPASFTALLRELWYRFEPADRMLLLPITPLDTLDYTSFTMHVGSKLVLDATGEPVTGDPPPRDVTDPAALDSRVRRHRLLEGGFLVVTVAREPRAVLETLVRHQGLGPLRFIVAVSEDVNLHDETNLLWGIFTRFDPARDLVCRAQRFVAARPVYEGPLGLDATWKPGYPLPLEMDPEIVRLVDRRWEEYWQ
ncbi:MAG TPA: UbiD family decarboxylase [Gemmatimonadales bacterium]|nr:UbiD family decarboxylase [Gemmatimonadales bacterium]